MRPEKITLQAFGSYGECQTIDLTRTTQNLFLISGATGSGKTTIFDAIVYALYGEASSETNKKDGGEMVSQFVPRGTEPFVELEFTDGGSRYTVRRSPAYDRPKKKGEGFTPQSERVTLLMPDGTYYNEKNIDSKLSDIVGLTKAQFMQVAMIAQGEFMTVLREKTREKKPIFRKLFGTEIYEKIVAEAKKRNDDAEEDIKNTAAQCQAELGYIAVPEDNAHADRIRALMYKLRHEKTLSGLTLDELTGELEAMCSELEAEQDELSEKKAEAQTARDDAYTRRDKAESLQSSFNSLEEAKKTLDKLKDSEEEMSEAGKLADRIDKAYSIEAEWRLFDKADKQLSDEKRRLEEENGKLGGLKKRAEDANAASEIAVEKYDAENRVYSAVKTRVDAARKTFADIAEAQENIEKYKTALKQAEKKAAKAKEELKKLENDEKKWRAEEETLKTVPEKLTGLENDIRRADELSGEIDRVKEAQQAAVKQKKIADTAAEKYRAAKRNYEVKDAEYSEAEKMFYDAQAGILARDRLKEGQPCPVCGSIHHPAPCQLSEAHSDLTREKLDALRKAMEQSRETMTICSEQSGKATTSWEERQKAFDDKLKALRDHLAKVIPEAANTDASENTENTEDSGNAVNADDTEKAEGIVVLERLLAAYRKGLAEKETVLKAQKVILEKLGKQLAGIDSRKQQLKEAAETAEQERRKAEINLNTEKTTLETLKAGLHYPDLPSAEDELTAADQKRAAAEKAKKQAEQAARSAAEALARCQEAIDTCEKNLPVYRDDRDQAEKKYKAVMQTAKLGEAEWKALCEAHSKDKSNELREFVSNFKKAKSAAEAKQETSLEAIDGREKPDLTALEAAAKDKNDTLERLTNEYGSIENTLTANRAALKGLASKAKTYSHQKVEYDVAHKLWQRLAGKVTGMRMDIETFVLRYYLQRILVYANRRFLPMTANQFELRMYEMEQAGEGRDHGLDLMVWSRVNGSMREARTLSGGESFMAALSIALGMADQIRQTTASMNLDVMFIDEGFGSLDDNARAQAVRVLKEMAGSDRLIGIISHVNELKKEIDDQLLIVKDDNGSHAKWQ